MGLTLLPLVEDGRAGVVHAFLLFILICLAAALVNALFRHVEGV